MVYENIPSTTSETTVGLPDIITISNVSSTNTTTTVQSPYTTVFSSGNYTTTATIFPSTSTSVSTIYYPTNYPPPVKNSSTVAATRNWNSSLYLVELINSTTITNPYAGFTVFYYFTNPTNQDITLQSMRKFSAAGMPAGDCPTFVVPALYSGIYTQSNISQAAPVQIFPSTGGSACPESDYGRFWTFLANSTYLTNSPTMTSVNITGYFAELPNCTMECWYVHPLDAGRYTVAVGDEWGDIGTPLRDGAVIDSIEKTQILR